jgi:hypothetical protein
MRSAALLFVLWAGLGSVWAEEPAPTIDEVAGERLQLLYSDDAWRVFSITMEQGDTLADHASGPRAILTLTELQIRALDGEAAAISAPPWHAMWLSNTFSRGFENIGDGPLRYLVMEARDRELQAEDVSRECSAGTPLLTNSALSICRFGEHGDEARVELDQPSWLYSEKPIFAAGTERHLMLASGSHTLPPSASPVVIVCFRPR